MSTYPVIGSGRQGCAAGYDMAHWGKAQEVVMADVNFEMAQAAVQRINALIGKAIARPLQMDVRDEQAVCKAMQGKMACLSAVPYYYNLPLTKLAIECGVNFCDLGGNIDKPANNIN